MTFDIRAGVLFGLIRLQIPKKAQSALEVSQEHMKITAPLEDYVAYDLIKHVTYLSHTAEGSSAALMSYTSKLILRKMTARVAVPREEILLLCYGW